MKDFIYLNGKKTEIDFQRSNILYDLIDRYSIKFKYKNIAVAVNMKIITKSKWKSFKIKRNDKIEIVTPFPGG
tara:strand:- start:877 stop:1095 length:219 start_codon:yes stop_codon:yes gene_type:complete